MELETYVSREVQTDSNLDQSLGIDEEAAKEPVQGTSAAGAGSVTGSTTSHLPGDDEDVIDARLKDYPVRMVARTVHLHNDPR